MALNRLVESLREIDHGDIYKSTDFIDYIEL
jgi:hypothetical protein